MCVLCFVTYWFPIVGHYRSLELNLQIKTTYTKKKYRKMVDSYVLTLVLTPCRSLAFICFPRSLFSRYFRQVVLEMISHVTSGIVIDHNNVLVRVRKTYRYADAQFRWFLPKELSHMIWNLYRKGVLLVVSST